jgi:hypothetical protein
MMYRTCERYLSGAITPDQFAIQAIRDQRMIVSVLAIEQLTGVVTPPTVVIRASGDASTGSATGEGLKVLADAQKAVRTAENNLQAATTKRSELDKADPKCADLKDDETDAARKKKRDDCKAADAAVAAAVKVRDAAQTELSDLNEFVRRGGLPTSAATGTEGSVFAGLNRPSDAQMRDVTLAITNIVDHVYNQDESLLFFIGKLADNSLDLRNACTTYVLTRINAEAKALDAEIYSESRQLIRQAAADRFDRFWAAVADQSGLQSDSVKVSSLVDRQLGTDRGLVGAEILRRMQEAPTSKERMQELFKQLAQFQQEKLAE